MNRHSDINSNCFRELQDQVIHPGLCTHCGTCAGLSEKTIHMKDMGAGPIPVCDNEASVSLPENVLEFCPGKGLNIPSLNEFVFEKLPSNWLIGNVLQFFIGYSGHPKIRRHGASGGVITEILIYLLENRLVDGVVAVKQGSPKPWQAEPVIARTREEILACSQSVYVHVPVNTILHEIKSFSGTLAYVGLPDQVMSIRKLQQLGITPADKIKYILGPYVGTIMYFGAIKSYLRSNGVRHLEDITSLKYREGEWPGYLEIKTKSGQIFRAEKFYYNYLIPFYITSASLLAVDFSNELSDVSVGDAWHPKFEKEGNGFSVVAARSERGMHLLSKMLESKDLVLDPISVNNATSMHGHMLDFKKRGAFIRMGWRKLLGKSVPDYGYQIVHIPWTRKCIEIVISSIFIIGKWPISRWLIERIPISFLGPVFNTLRKSWKGLSKPTKRKGLQNLHVRMWQ